MQLLLLLVCFIQYIHFKQLLPIIAHIIAEVLKEENFRLISLVFQL